MVAARWLLLISLRKFFCWRPSAAGKLTRMFTLGRRRGRDDCDWRETRLAMGPGNEGTFICPWQVAGPSPRPRVDEPNRLDLDDTTTRLWCIGHSVLSIALWQAFFLASTHSPAPAPSPAGHQILLDHDILSAPLLSTWVPPHDTHMALARLWYFRWPRLRSPPLSSRHHKETLTRCWTGTRTRSIFRSHATRVGEEQQRERSQLNMSTYM